MEQVIEEIKRIIIADTKNINWDFEASGNKLICKGNYQQFNFRYHTQVFIETSPQVQANRIITTFTDRFIEEMFYNG